MKICLPVQEDKGLESIPYNHFGSAPYFLIYNTENGDIKVIGNGDMHHKHGMCEPLKALRGESIDAVLVGGIGQGALMKLNLQGIHVYRAVPGTVADNVKLLEKDELPEFMPGHTCNHGGGCSH